VRRTNPAIPVVLRGREAAAPAELLQEAQSKAHRLTVIRAANHHAVAEGLDDLDPVLPGEQRHLVGERQRQVGSGLVAVRLGERRVADEVGERECVLGLALQHLAAEA